MSSFTPVSAGTGMGGGVGGGTLIGKIGGGVILWLVEFKKL